MDLLAGFLGFSVFTVTCLVIGLLGYWQADWLESKAQIYTRRIKRESAKRGLR